MGTKLVVGADGIAQEVPTTPEDDAQAALDAAAWSIQFAALLADAVDAERDRRIALPLAINFANPTRTFQVNMDADALRNMNGLASAAILTKMLNSSTPTNFIAWDNSIISLSPDDLIALGLQVQTRISKMTFAGRAIKNMSPIPEDFANDKYWN